MNYYIIAGEASGDLHASNLMKEIKLLDREANFRCWGGDLMEKQGSVLVKHYRDLAFMGFTEVVMNLHTIFKNINFCKKDILEFRPDVIILVDYPGFNLRIAQFAKANGIKVFYYISPQIWAWKESRIHQIKRTVDKMFVILPFEKDFYKKYNYDVDFVGHPLLDAIENFASPQPSPEEREKVIAILPGSRKQEIAKMLPVMLSIKNDFKDFRFVIAAAPSVPKEFYENFTSGNDIEIVYGQTYDLLKQATAAIVTSGTATLETALFEVPEVVCYKGGSVSYYIAKLLVKVKFISLVNLIMDKEVVKELIQTDFNAENLKAELKKILFDEPKRNEIKENYILLKQKLGGKGASKKTAELMIQYLLNK